MCAMQVNALGRDLLLGREAGGESAAEILAPSPLCVPAGLSCLGAGAASWESSDLLSQTASMDQELPRKQK